MAMASDRSSRSTPVPGWGSSDMTARHDGSGVSAMKST